MQRSDKQYINTPAGLLWLPDFRNFGTLLRIIVIAELVSFVTLLAGTDSFDDAWKAFSNWGRIYEPSLLVNLLFLALFSPQLQGLRYWVASALVTIFACLTTAALAALLAALTSNAPLEVAVRSAVLAAALTLALLSYFRARAERLSPAGTEARLVALRARIRPHFLFNSINSVVALVHTDPDRAESVLLDLSDLFRAALSEERDLVTLSKEISLARAYLDIETTRLGKRLKVDWDLPSHPVETLVPQLLLQPLIENAVRHGVESLPEGGTVTIRVTPAARWIYITVQNPVSPTPSKVSGNQIALRNIKERLALHYDEEAHLKIDDRGDSFIVEIRMPVRAPDAG